MILAQRGSAQGSRKQGRKPKRLRSWARGAWIARYCRLSQQHTLARSCHRHPSHPGYHAISAIMHLEYATFPSRLFAVLSRSLGQHPTLRRHLSDVPETSEGVAQALRVTATSLGR